MFLLLPLKSATSESETRKKHNEYSEKITGYLMSIVLADDGHELAIQRLLVDMKDGARQTVEKQEREKRRL